MTQSEHSENQLRFRYLVPLVLVLGAGAFLGIRALDDAPPVPQVQRMSPGARAASATPSDSPKDSTPTGEQASAKPEQVDHAQAFQAALDAEQAGELDRAYSLALRAAGSGARAHRLQLAKIAIMRSKHADALRPLEDILREDPDDADALYNLGIVWQSGQSPDFERARSHYLATLRAQPRYAAARYNLVILCADHKDFEQAKLHLELFEEAWPAHANLESLRTSYAQRLAAGTPVPVPGAHP